jgi:EpsI family protein
MDRKKIQTSAAPELISHLTIPTSAKGWISKDFSQEIKIKNDQRYNFLSDVFARIYQNRQGRQVLLLALEAENFHHPKVCYRSSGFTPVDLPATDLGGFQAPTILVQRDDEAFVIMYWMVINGKQADWTQQKWRQFWNSFSGQTQTGLMLRMDVPLIDGSPEMAIKTAQELIMNLKRDLSSNNQALLFGAQ